MPGWKTEHLGRHHDRAGFDCGNPDLSDWFRKQSGQFDDKDLARTYVLADPDRPGFVVGYYAISACQVRYDELPPGHSRGLPRSMMIPAALLGKLAIATDHQGRGFGSFLLVDALRRMLHLADAIGIRVVAVDAVDLAAAAFYGKQGFVADPDKTGRLFMPMGVVRGMGLGPLSESS